jgi:hypothetical protein
MGDRLGPEYAPAAETRIPAKDDPDLGPGFTKTIDQQFQNRTAVLGCIDAAGAQVSRQKMIPAENIEG